MLCHLLYQTLTIEGRWPIGQITAFKGQGHRHYQSLNFVIWEKLTNLFKL